RSYEEHLRHLEEVFRLLEEANLTIAGDKCEIGRSEVTYLGHVFNDKGMSPDAAKVEAILRWPVPTTASELRSFVGLAGYYRHFVSHFSSVVRPLYALEPACKKEKSNSLLGKWKEEQDTAFLHLKCGLASLPALAYPDFEQPFQLVTDASDYAIGAVLEQQGRPLAFYSQALSGAQLRWPVYEKEAYAIFKA
ncbi:retrovirus polyprotein, putative, partial [Perkinsus marinus ATCC 50983]